MGYINEQPAPRTRRVKAKGEGQGAHGGQGLHAWLNFVKEGKSGASGFPVRIKGLRYVVSATVTVNGDVFDVSVDISGAGDLHLSQPGLSAALAKDFLADFNRRWRHIIDPSEPIQEIEYVEDRPRRTLDYTWAPPNYTPVIATPQPVDPYDPEPVETYEPEPVESQCYVAQPEVIAYKDPCAAPQEKVPYVGLILCLVGIAIGIFAFFFG